MSYPQGEIRGELSDSRKSVIHKSTAIDSHATIGRGAGRPNERAPSADGGPSLDYYAELDAEIDDAEDDGIRARWQFGRALLMERVGRKLPEGLLDRLSAELQKSRGELKHRMRFAQRFDTEAALDNAIIQWRSWFRIVNEAMASTAHLSAEKDEWATPRALFDALEKHFGFTVDVCATPENAKCARYWTRNDDGLDRDWTGEVCWMNPPYSELEDWIVKASDASRDGATVVCLLPSRTDVAWFWDYARYGQIWFVRGRLSFVDDLGNTGPAPFPSALVVFGPDYPPGVVWYEP